MCIKISQFENSLHLYLYLVLLGSEKTDLDHEGDKGFENAIPYRKKNTEKLYIIDNFLKKKNPKNVLLITTHQLSHVPFDL